ALQLMGHPLNFIDCFILESLGQAARSAAFIIPGGLGAQEGAFLLIGGALGVPPEYALALSLVKRASQLLFGLPMLALWPFLERRRKLGRSRYREPNSLSPHPERSRRAHDADAIPVTTARQRAQRVEIAADQCLLLGAGPALDLALGGNRVSDA